MRTENLYYFLEVAQTKSITQAAKNLYISQQSLSRIISSLEDEFHTTLFIRKKNGVDLTKAGTLFLAQANDLLSIYNQMHTLDTTYNTQRCRIAIDKRINPKFFSRIFNLISDYPQIKFSMQEKDSTLEILESISHDTTDLGIAIFFKDELNQMSLYKGGFGKTFTLQTLASDNLYVLFHEDFPLVKVEKMSIEVLLQYPCVFYTKDTLYYGMLKNFPSHTLNVFLETDNLLTTLDCINSKNAISILVASLYMIF